MPHADMAVFFRYCTHSIAMHLVCDTAIIYTGSEQRTPSSVVLPYGVRIISSVCPDVEAFKSPCAGTAQSCGKGMLCREHGRGQINQAFSAFLF